MAFSLTLTTGFGNTVWIVLKKHQQRPGFTAINLGEADARLKVTGSRFDAFPLDTNTEIT